VALGEAELRGAAAFVPAPAAPEPRLGEEPALPPLLDAPPPEEPPPPPDPPDD
jgi:hypothetical protein